MLALQRGVSDSTAYNPVNNSTMGELDDDSQHEADSSANLKKEIEAMQSGTVERRIGVREWRRFERISQGSVGNGVMRSYVRPFILFHLQLHLNTLCSSSG